MVSFMGSFKTGKTMVMMEVRLDVVSGGQRKILWSAGHVPYHNLDGGHISVNVYKILHAVYFRLMLFTHFVTYVRPL